MPSIRLFPHDPAQFRTREELATWLDAEMRKNGGRYRLVTSGAPPKELPAGTVVLFRHGHYLVGEAAVASYDRRPFTEDGVEYAAQVFFNPDTIRVFTPPVR